MAPVTEADRVRAWRTRQLRALGYTVYASEQIADQFDVDVHELADLIHAGASRLLAYAILAPLEERQK